MLAAMLLKWGWSAHFSYEPPPMASQVNSPNSCTRPSHHAGFRNSHAPKGADRGMYGVFMQEHGG